MATAVGKTSSPRPNKPTKVKEPLSESRTPDAKVNSAYSTPQAASPSEQGSDDTPPKPSGSATMPPPTPKEDPSSLEPRSIDHNDQQRNVRQKMKKARIGTPPKGKVESTTAPKITLEPKATLKNNTEAPRTAEDAVEPTTPPKTTELEPMSTAPKLSGASSEKEVDDNVTNADQVATEGKTGSSPPEEEGSVSPIADSVDVSDIGDLNPPKSGDSAKSDEASEQIDDVEHGAVVGKSEDSSKSEDSTEQSEDVGHDAVVEKSEDSSKSEGSTEQSEDVGHDAVVEKSEDSTESEEGSEQTEDVGHDAVVKKSGDSAKVEEAPKTIAGVGHDAVAEKVHSKNSRPSTPDTSAPVPNTDKDSKGRLISPRKKRSRDQLDNEPEAAGWQNEKQAAKEGQGSTGKGDKAAEPPASTTRAVRDEPEKKRPRDNSQEPKRKNKSPEPARKSSAPAKKSSEPAKKSSDPARKKSPEPAKKMTSKSAFANTSAVSPAGTLGAKMGSGGTGSNEKQAVEEEQGSSGKVEKAAEPPASTTRAVREEPKKKRPRDTSQEPKGKGPEPAKSKSPEPAKRNKSPEPAKKSLMTSKSAFANTSATSPFGTLGATIGSGGSGSKSVFARETSGAPLGPSLFGASSASAASPFGALGPTTTSSGFNLFRNAGLQTASSGGAGFGPKSAFSNVNGLDGSKLPAPSAFGSGPFGLAKLGGGVSGGFSLSGGTVGGLASSAGAGVLGVTGSSAKPFGAPDSDADDTEGDEESQAEGDVDDHGDVKEGKDDHKFQQRDVETGEEGEENLFQARAKLYFFQTNGTVKAWKERGFGILKLNVTAPPPEKRKFDDLDDYEDLDDEDPSAIERASASKSDGEPATKRARLLMRSEAVHKVILNTQVYKGMMFGKEAPTDRVVRFTAIEEDDQPTQLQLKFGQPSFAADLWHLVKQVENDVGSI
ncbi:MAG: hypothetical protein M1826_004502 [Phylliscum demangeonii]|nr:MAG: hypothetical protein M1826_004502 [Phylliscum demangeonii]